MATMMDWEEDAVMVEFPLQEDKENSKVPKERSKLQAPSKNLCSYVTPYRKQDTDEDEKDLNDGTSSDEGGFSLLSDVIHSTFGVVDPDPAEIRPEVDPELSDSEVLSAKDTTFSLPEKEVDDADSDSTQPLVSLWKLAGRTIKKNSYGKFLLDGIKEGMEDTKKVLGIGVGEILIELTDATQTFKVDDIVQGRVHLDLTELDLETESLTICLQGIRQDSTGMPVVVCAAEKELKDFYTYSEGESVPFDIQIPPAEPLPTSDAMTWDRWISSTLQMDDSMLSPAMEWSLTATLRIPGRLSMKNTISIEVADTENEM